MAELLLIFIFLIIMSGFFSGSEMAFISANRLNLEVESRKDSWTGKAVKHFMRNPETFLTTTLVGNNIANVAFATLASFFLAAPLATAYQGWTGAAPPVRSEERRVGKERSRGWWGEPGRRSVT